MRALRRVARPRPLGHAASGGNLDLQLCGGYSESDFSEGGCPMPQAYCMKCRTKREMKNPEKVILKNGRPATRGTCPNCGTKMSRIGG